jgi:hypothetical protein
MDQVVKIENVPFSCYLRFSEPIFIKICTKILKLKYDHNLRTKPIEPALYPQIIGIDLFI